MENAFECTLIKFTASDKMKLDGILIGRNKKTCVIYLHGMNGNFYKSNIPLELSKSNKFSVFSINTRGHDVISTIKTKNNKKSVLAGTGAEVFTNAKYDIEGAIKTIASLGFDRIFLAGHSTGCQKITYYASIKKDKRISGIILFAPADDLSITKKEGSRFENRILKARNLIKHNEGDTPMKEFGFFTPKRFLSAYYFKSIEANIFYYNGQLKLFSSIKLPILAIFGSKEEYRDRKVSKYLSILENKSQSKYFSSVIIKNAMHSFYNHEFELRKNVEKWLEVI